MNFLKITCAFFLSPLGIWRLIRGSWLGVIYPVLWLSSLLSFGPTKHFYVAWIAIPILIFLWSLDIKSTFEKSQSTLKFSLAGRVGFVLLGLFFQYIVLILLVLIALKFAWIEFPNSLR